MRWNTMIMAGAVLMLGVLAACGGEAPTPTATSAPQFSVTGSAPDAGTAEVGSETTAGEVATPDVLAPTETIEPTAAAARATIESFVLPTLPPPGTGVAVATLEPAVAAATFSRVLYIQQSADNSRLIMIELFPDGRLVREGETLQVAAERVQAVDALLDAINFMNLEGVFTGPLQSQTDYYYTLQVEYGDLGSRSVNTQDGYTPPELLTVFSALLDMSDGVAAEQTAAPAAS